MAPPNFKSVCVGVELDADGQNQKLLVACKRKMTEKFVYMPRLRLVCEQMFQETSDSDASDSDA